MRRPRLSTCSSGSIPRAQKSVLAHELTHALQDQNYGLEKWAEGKGKPKTDAEIVANDEESSAKQAVIEGQAMITMLSTIHSRQSEAAS